MPVTGQLQEPSVMAAVRQLPFMRCHRVESNREGDRITACFQFREYKFIKPVPDLLNVILPAPEGTWSPLMTAAPNGNAEISFGGDLDQWHALGEVTSMTIQRNRGSQLAHLSYPDNGEVTVSGTLEVHVIDQVLLHDLLSGASPNYVELDVHHGPANPEAKVSALSKPNLEEGWLSKVLAKTNPQDLIVLPDLLEDRAW